MGAQQQYMNASLASLDLPSELGVRLHAVCQPFFHATKFMVALLSPYVELSLEGAFPSPAYIDSLSPMNGWNRVEIQPAALPLLSLARSLARSVGSIYHLVFNPFEKIYCIAVASGTLVEQATSPAASLFPQAGNRNLSEHNL